MKHVTITSILLGIILLTFLLAGCDQVATEPVPSPDTSIVWSDDFEDGDLAGWEIVSTGLGRFSVDGQFLQLEVDAPNIHFPSVIERSSSITSGTWSFDLNILEDPDVYRGDASCYVGLFGNISMDNEYKDDPVNDWWENPDLRSLAINIGFERLYFSLINAGKNIIIAQYSIKDISGLQHYDVTRDESGHTLVFLNGEQIFEFTDDTFSDSQVFYISCNNSLITLDNIVVRDKVIDILPPGE